MNGVIATVGEVELLARELGMTQLVVVPALHGSWHLPGVDLTVQQQWAQLVVAVHALPGGGPLGREEWSARFSSAVPAAVVARTVRDAVLPAIAAAS